MAKFMSQILPSTLRPSPSISYLGFKKEKCLMISTSSGNSLIINLNFGKK
jgi:hypothetical protein